MAKRRAEYQVQLELQRDQERLARKQQMKEENRKRDEESVGSQEQIKRQTLEYEYQLKAALKQEKLDKERALQDEVQGKNQSFVREMFGEAEKQKRETQRQNMVTAMNIAGNQAQSLLTNPKFMAKALYMVVLGFSAFYFSKIFISVGATFLMSRFGKPALVRETSKIYTKNMFMVPWLLTRRMIHRNIRRTEKDLLDGVILEPELETQLREISYAVLNRRKHFAPAKNLMFYGPPGTGKTLFAKKLATKSGLDFAIMVGSDIAPLGPLAVRELNKLWDWAEMSTNGMIIFIDEADAFLRERRSAEMSEFMRHTINSFLYRTGTPSDNVLLVLATNSPEQLDEAVHDRVDEIVAFKLPSLPERRTMLYHYLVMYCQPPVTPWEKAVFLYKHPRSIYTGKKLIRMEGVSHDVIQNFAEKTEGFSGREIQKMTVAFHDAAFTLAEPVLSPELMEKILKKFHI